MNRRELRGAAAFACLLLFILAVMALAHFSKGPETAGTAAESLKKEIPSGVAQRDSIDFSSQRRDSVYSAPKTHKQGRKLRKPREAAPAKDLDSPLSHPI